MDYTGLCIIKLNLRPLVWAKYLIFWRATQTHKPRSWVLLNPNVGEQKPHKTQHAEFGIQNSYTELQLVWCTFDHKEKKWDKCFPKESIKGAACITYIVLWTYEPVNAAAACWAHKPMKRFLAWSFGNGIDGEIEHPQQPGWLQGHTGSAGCSHPSAPVHPRGEEKGNTRNSPTHTAGKDLLQQNQMGTSAKNREVTFPLCSCQTPPGMLHTVLVSPAWEGHGASPEEAMRFIRGLENLP